MRLVVSKAPKIKFKIKIEVEIQLINVNSCASWHADALSSDT
jgi:hypothetical protein